MNCTLGFLILAYGVPLRLTGIPVAVVVPVVLVVPVLVLGLTLDAKEILLKDGVVVDEVEDVPM